MAEYTRPSQESGRPPNESRPGGSVGDSADTGSDPSESLGARFSTDRVGVHRIVHPAVDPGDTTAKAQEKIGYITSLRKTLSVANLRGHEVGATLYSTDGESHKLTVSGAELTGPKPKETTTAAGKDQTTGEASQPQPDAKVDPVTEDQNGTDTDTGQTEVAAEDDSNTGTAEDTGNDTGKNESKKQTRTRQSERAVLLPRGGKGSTVSDEEFEADMSEFPAWKRVTGDYTVVDFDNQLTQMLPATGVDVEGDILPMQNGQPYAIHTEGFFPDPEAVKRHERDVRRKWDQAREDEAGGYGAVHSTLDQKVHGDRANELRQGKEYGKGIWGVNIAIGGQTPEDADDLAARFAIAAGHPNLAYRWNVDPETYASLAEAISKGKEHPLIGTSDMLAHVFPFPDSEEISGIDREERPAFSPNIRGAKFIRPQDRMVTGEVVDTYDNKTADLTEDASRAPEHRVVSGPSGHGKSTYLKRYVSEAVKAGERAGHNPGVLIIDPKEYGPDDIHDYADLPQILDKTGRKVTIVRVGDPEAVPIGGELFRPREGESLWHRADTVANILISAIAASGHDDPGAKRSLTQYVGETLRGSNRGGKEIQSIYAKMGWDMKLNESNYPGGDPPYPTMTGYIDYLQEVLEDYGYEGEGKNLAKFVPSFVDAANQGYMRDFWKAYPVDMAELQHGVTVMEIGEIRNPMAKSIIMNTWFDEIAHGLNGRDPFHFLTEEGNLVIPAGSDASDYAVGMYQRLRSRNASATIALQNPSKADSDILGNAGTSVVFGATSEDDIKAITPTLGGLNQAQTEYLPELQRGEAIFRGPGTKASRVYITPAEVPADSTATARGSEALVAVREGEALLTQEQKDRAEKFVRTTDEGKFVEFWANLAVVTDALGWPDHAPDREHSREIGFEAFDKLKAMGEDDGERKKRDYAVRESVRKAVEARFDLLLRDESVSLDPLIDKISSRMLGHIDGKEMEPAGERRGALKPFAEVDAKDDEHTYLRTNAFYINERRSTGKGLGKLTGAAELSSDQKRAVIEEVLGGQLREGFDPDVVLPDIITEYQQRAAALDTQLAGMTAITLDPETGQTTHHADHPVYKSIDERSGNANAKTRIADLLIPPNPGKHTIDNSLPISIGDLETQEDIDKWLSAYEGMVQVFDVGQHEDRYAAIVTEHQLVLQRHVGRRQAAKENSVAGFKGDVINLIKNTFSGDQPDAQPPRGNQYGGGANPSNG